jgi:hypothetical protein
MQLLKYYNNKNEKKKKKGEWWKEKDKQGYKTMVFIVNSLNVLIEVIAYPSIYFKWWIH